MLIGISGKINEMQEKQQNHIFEATKPVPGLARLAIERSME
jgi:hypothetical protein